MRRGKSFSGRKGREAGQSMLEFALAAIIFLTLLLNIMNMGYAIYCYHTISNAAREAVRYAIVRGPNSTTPATIAQIQQIAVNSAIGVNLSTSNVTVSWPSDPRLTSQKDVKVVVNFPYNLIMPPVNVTLSSTSQMLVSR